MEPEVAFLRDLFDAAVSAAHPAQVLAPCLPAQRDGRLVVIGAGKAAAAMAQALEAAWEGELEGRVITRYGHGAVCRKIEVVEAAHPVPDAAGEGFARDMLQRVKGLSEQDEVIVLLSGGGSALLALPAPGNDAAGQAGHQPRAVEVGGQHRRDELRP